MQSIVFDSVHKTFRRSGFFCSRQKVETHALKGVSLEVFPGEVVALLGPNGSGKSTTLKLISTMLLPDRGQVVVNGFDSHLSSHSVRRQVGFAVAAERSFSPRLTVRENLDFFAALEDIPRRDRPERIGSLLTDVNLAEAAQKQVMKLSSGMYQRLGIARALLKRPSVLLLDEPTRSLDPSASSSLWRLVQGLSKTGVTTVLATHNFAEAVAVSDRIAVLQRGELLAVRHTGGLSVEQLRRFYLEVTGECESRSWLEEVPA